jgi:hypothetical protein
MARTAGTLCGGMPQGKTNRAYNDGSLQYQYFQNETQAYTQAMGPYASNVYAADMQGLDPDNFYDWQRVKIRSIRAAQAQTGETMPDDWQRIYLIDPARYTYIPQGAMLKYADNTWIVYKGKNMEAILGAAIVRRCNAVINVLDWYGNVVSVPMSYAKMGTLGNATHATENTITSKNYIACICQLNEYSKSFTENTRIILGDTAYAMRGMDDFTREFTDDPGSVHLLTFTIERVEVQPFDNIELGVADYGGFSWDLAIDWNNSMKVGMTQQLKVTSKRNNTAVASSEEHQITYLYESSDESVLTVEENGLVTAVGEGTASVTVSLEQNSSITQTVEIEVPAAENAYVAFTSTIPAKMHESDAITVSAAYFEDGEATMNAVEFTFSGPEDGAFTVAQLMENTYMVTSYHASQKPLTVTASYDNHTVSAEIYLVT